MMRKLMQHTWQLPYGYVPSGQHRFLEAHDYRRARWVFKYFKRLVFFGAFAKMFGRVRCLNRIPRDAFKILWVNWAAPSLGDAIMDLSARSLLAGRCLTLLTHPKNADLFIHDEVFDLVVSDHKDLLGKSFDLVICDSFSPRVLKRKIQVAPHTDFVGLYGFLNGFEVHRTYFAWARMRELLGLSMSACPDLDAVVSVADISRHKTNENLVDIVVAVGGEWRFRTFSKWFDVIDELLRKGFSIRLVGSINGQVIANQIRDAFPSVQDFVGKTSIREAVSLIQNSRLFLGSDGGLWHCAVGVGVPSVTLFADCEIFDSLGRRVTRETVNSRCLPLYAEHHVDEISVNEIVSAAERWFEKYQLRLIDA